MDFINYKAHFLNITSFNIVIYIQSYEFRCSHLWMLDLQERAPTLVCRVSALHDEFRRSKLTADK